MVSKHVVRDRGKRRKVKGRDIQGWMVSAMAVSSQVQEKALTSPEMSCFESQSLFLSDSPPHHFQTCQMASLTYFNTTGAEWFLCWLRVSFKKGGFLCYSESETIRLLPASTFFDLLWWVHRVESGVLSAHARMYWPPNWPPASTPPTGLWLALYQTAVPGATGGRPRLCPGQQLHWPDSAWWDGPRVPLPLCPNSFPARGRGEGKLNLNYTKKWFCGRKAIKKLTVLFSIIDLGILFLNDSDELVNEETFSSCVRGYLIINIRTAWCYVSINIKTKQEYNSPSKKKMCLGNHPRCLDNNYTQEYYLIYWKNTHRSG